MPGVLLLKNHVALPDANHKHSIINTFRILVVEGIIVLVVGLTIEQFTMTCEN